MLLRVLAAAMRTAVLASTAARTRMYAERCVCIAYAAARRDDVLVLIV